jgi:uncharacterized protein (DUF1919 family)/GT2 family glycosyltransferase
MHARELAAIVLSYGNDDTVVGAVDSLLAQRPQVEVVVSHSGGGSTPALLRRTHPSVRVVSSEERRSPGAARNAGVAVTAAPYVSFLAADCRAVPGWSAGRLRRHRDGAQAVASVLVPAEHGSVPLAAHLLQNSFRMGHVAASPMRRSGLSYSRDVLERYGPFPETFPFGEDIALNDRLIEAGVEIAVASDVVTAHRYPTSVRGLLVDRYRRGRQRGAVYRTPLRRSSVGLAGALLTPALALRRARARGSGLSYRQLVAVTPLLVAGSLATAIGTVVGGGPAGPQSCPELVSLRRRTWPRRASAAASLPVSMPSRQEVSQSVDRRRLGRARFCLIADDCWGADVYHHLDRPYNTPFVGLFLKSEHYLRLLGDLESYLAQPLGFRDEPGVIGDVRYPVGVLGGDVEIHFQHYPSREDAATTWSRRVARVDLDHLAVKFRAPPQPPGGDQIERFLALPFERKVAFSVAAAPGAVHVPNWNWDNAFTETQRVFDVVAWLKGKPPRRPGRGRLIYGSSATGVV